MTRRSIAWVGSFASLFLCAGLCHAGGFGFSMGGGGGGFSFGGGHGGFGFGGGHGGHFGGHDGGHWHGNDHNHWGHNHWQSHQPTHVHTVAPAPIVRRPAAPVTTVAAAVKPNVPAPEKIVALRANARFNLGELMPQPCYGLLGEVARTRAQGNINDLEPMLAALGNQNVMTAWTAIKGRVPQVQAISAADLQQLQTAIVAIAELPAGFNRDDVNARLTRLAGLSKMIVLLSTPWPERTWTPGIPRGDVSVIYCPCLPKGKHYWLPSGDLACGMGGAGEMALTSGEATRLLDLPLGVGSPMPDSDADVAKRVTNGVLLMNPVENNATVKYVLANKNYSLIPSYKQALEAGQTWVVAFDRGGRYGQAKYTLAKGTYVFGGSKRGWELFNQKFDVTIDNTAGTEPFFYAIDNKEAEVPAGGKASYSSEYPMLVRFDRGDGMQPSQKKIEKQGIALVVALNGADGLWDLYPASNFPGQKLTRTPPQPERPLVLTPAVAPVAELSAAPKPCE